MSRPTVLDIKQVAMILSIYALFQVQDLEERLVEKEQEIKQMKRNLDESEGAIAQVNLIVFIRFCLAIQMLSFWSLTPAAHCMQVFEGKQRLWEQEVDELKRLYATKLRQVSQHAQRSQRSLQMQLYKTQQEKSQLQGELDNLKKERRQDSEARAKPTSPTLEETQWEASSH